jgi:two-component system, NtrC family, response regulator HydG
MYQANSALETEALSRPLIETLTERMVVVPKAPRAPKAARFGVLYGSSPGMVQVYKLIERVAHTEATVLIVGESGSGKELVANSIHRMSARGKQPFVAVNCGAIPATLIEAELFGYEKGAFTGAVKTHRGYLERASAGTLFLDEITEMPLEMQVRLLRVLETGLFCRVGGDQEIRAEARIIAATNRDPASAVADNRLREDLMYRLAVFPINLPPLRARGEDVELLARQFLSELNAQAGSHKQFSAASLTLLRTHQWPGNVRELKNCVQRAFILADEEIELQQLVAPLRSAVSEHNCLRFAIGTSLAAMERKTIFATLEHCSGNKRRAAEVLGVSLKTLYNRLTEYAAQSQGAAESSYQRSDQTLSSADS